MSSGRPIRRSGAASAIASPNVSSVAAIILDSNGPGATAFTVIARGPSSLASTRVIWCAGRLEQRQERPGQEERRLQVEVNDLVPGRGGELRQRRTPGRTGVVDQNVQGLFPLADQSGQAQALRLGAGIGLARADVHAGSGLQQAARDHQPDPAGSPGYHGCLSGQVEQVHRISCAPKAARIRAAAGRKRTPAPAPAKPRGHPSTLPVEFAHGRSSDLLPIYRALAACGHARDRFRAALAPSLTGSRRASPRAREVIPSVSSTPRSPSCSPCYLPTSSGAICPSGTWPTRPKGRTRSSSSPTAPPVRSPPTGAARCAGAVATGSSPSPTTTTCSATTPPISPGRLVTPGTSMRGRCCAAIPPP